MNNNYYWCSFIALQDEIWGGADEEHIIYAYALALGSRFMMETFLSLAIRLAITFNHLYYSLTIGSASVNVLLKSQGSRDATHNYKSDEFAIDCALNYLYQSMIIRWSRTRMTYLPAYWSTSIVWRVAET